MFAFTKQEQRFILFLLFSFLLGLGVSYYRKAQLARPNPEWAAAQERMLSDFRARNQAGVEVTNSDTLAVAKPDAKTGPPETSKARLVGRVNINTASAEELASLPRIGLFTAQKIIEYRQQKGAFRAIEDLQKIKGIGPATFERIREHITVNASRQ